LNEVSFVVDIIKFIKENNDYHVFDECPHNEGFQVSKDEISYVDLLGIENFLSNSPRNNLDVGFNVLDDNSNFCGQERIYHTLKIFMESEFKTINQELVKIILSQVGTRKFISNIQNQIVMGCKIVSLPA
jgi:hypothetical protein